MTPGSNEHEPPTKKTACDELQNKYEKMLKSRGQAKKDQDEWKYFLHQMYYTRDPDHAKKD